MDKHVLANDLMRYKPIRIPIIDKFVAGAKAVSIETVNDEIDAWHKSSASVFLFQWLGFTAAEYRRFVLEPSSLFDIVEERKHNALPRL